MDIPASQTPHSRTSLLAQRGGWGELRQESGSFGLRPTTVSPFGLPLPCHLPPAELSQVNAHRPPQRSFWVCPASDCWRASQIRAAAALGTQPNAVQVLPSSPRAPRSRRRLCWLHTALGRAPQDGHSSGVTAKGQWLHPCRPCILLGMEPSMQVWRAEGGCLPVSRAAKSRTRPPEPHGVMRVGSCPVPAASTGDTRERPSGRADPRLHTDFSHPLAPASRGHGADQGHTWDCHVGWVGRGFIWLVETGAAGHCTRRLPQQMLLSGILPSSNDRCPSHVQGLPRTPSWNASLV